MNQYDRDNNQHAGVNPGIEDQQATRVMPSLGGDSGRVASPAPSTQGGSTPVRHRRAARYAAQQQDTQEDSLPPMPAAPEQSSGVRRVPPVVQQPAEPQAPAQGRVRANQRGSASPQAAQGVPRPAALMRAPNQGQSVQTAGPVQRPTQGNRRAISDADYAQQPPVQERPFARPAARDARQPADDAPRVRRPQQPIYEEDDWAPAQPQENPPRRGKRRGCLIGLAAAVVVIGLVVLAFLLLPNDDSALGSLKGQVQGALTGMVDNVTSLLSHDASAPAEVQEFSAAPTKGTAPMDVVFTLTTNKAAMGVRVVDASGNPLTATAAPYSDNAESRIWMLTLSMDGAWSGTVEAQVQDAQGVWTSSGRTQELEITEQALATIATDVFNQAEETLAMETATPTPAMVTFTPEPTATATATLEPTATPSPTPSPTPTATPSPTPTATPTPSPTPSPTPLPDLTAEAVESAVASNLITSETVYEGTKKNAEYARDEESGYNMGDQSNYLLLDFGVTTFRGSNFRQNAASGNVSRLPSAMSVAWTQEAGSVKGSSKTYYGIGWTGQPAIVKWSKEVRETTNIVEEKRNVTALKEVILAGLDGKIYFFDLADGVPTRDAIDVGYPMKGSVSVSSYGMPIMTVGQYARKMASGTGDIGLRFFNLLTQKQIYLLDGLDDRAVGVEGSFDTAALFDRTNDGLVVAGTNGMLYTIDMNTEYDAKMGSISIDPEEQLLVAKASGQKSKTVQVLSSMAMYSHYAYYADMTGILHCVDTDTMKTVWAVELGDAVQAAVSLDFDEDGTLWVYTANTLQNRSKGTCDIRRFNAMTGEEGWALSVGVTKGDSSAIPGAMASPVLGEGNIDHLAIFTLSKLSSEPGISVTAEAPGAVIAVNKQTGTVEWTYALNAYTYSSPVAVYTENGEARIIQCDSDGNIYLLDGLTGSLVSTLKVEGNIEGSPAVYMDTMVVGTTGKNTSYIYGITLQ